MRLVQQSVTLGLNYVAAVSLQCDIFVAVGTLGEGGRGGTGGGDPVVSGDEVTYRGRKKRGREVQFPRWQKWDEAL